MPSEGGGRTGRVGGVQVSRGGPGCVFLPSGNLVSEPEHPVGEDATGHGACSVWPPGWPAL